MVVEAEFLKSTSMDPPLGYASYVFAKASQVLRLQNVAVRVLIWIEWEDVTFGQEVIGNPMWCVGVVVVVVEFGRVGVSIAVSLCLVIVRSEGVPCGCAGVRVVEGDGGSRLRFNTLLSESVDW